MNVSGSADGPTQRTEAPASPANDLSSDPSPSSSGPTTHSERFAQPLLPKCRKAVTKSNTPLSRAMRPTNKNTKASSATFKCWRIALRTASLGRNRATSTPAIEPAPNIPTLPAASLNSFSRNLLCEALSESTVVAKPTMRRSTTLSKPRIAPARVTHTCPVNVWIRFGTRHKKLANIASAPPLGVMLCTTSKLDWRKIAINRINARKSLNGDIFLAIGTWRTRTRSSMFRDSWNSFVLTHSVI